MCKTLFVLYFSKTGVLSAKTLLQPISRERKRVIKVTHFQTLFSEATKREKRWKTMHNLWGFTSNIFASYIISRDYLSPGEEFLLKSGALEERVSIIKNHDNLSSRNFGTAYVSLSILSMRPCPVWNNTLEVACGCLWYSCSLLPNFGGKSCRQLAFSAGNSSGQRGFKNSRKQEIKKCNQEEILRKFRYKALRNINPGTNLVSGKLSVLLERFIVTFTANVNLYLVNKITVRLSFTVDKFL